MTTLSLPPETEVEIYEQHDPRLGRHKVHDPRSRAFAVEARVDRSSWHNKRIRVYDPIPNPRQRIGCCTWVDLCVRFNSVGNRKMGVVLDMADAERGYARTTEVDPFLGTYPPDDTGSYGLAAATVAREFGLGGEYRWNFAGADLAIQLVMMGTAVGFGTKWYDGMFNLDSRGFVQVAGSLAGGHQWTLRGYDADYDAGVGRCWWGRSFKDFLIKRSDLDGLVRDGGDSVIQRRAA